MGHATFRGDLVGGKTLVGTFMKTPALDVLEVLILSGLDFVCLDAEHAPFDRAAMNACGALARAADLPLLVRVPQADAAEIGAALDLGATGVVVPHVIDVATATRVARAARFGHGGRGFAGSTRWAGFAGSDMATLLERSRSETVVIAQIEDPEAVACCEGYRGGRRHRRAVSRPRRPVGRLWQDRPVQPGTAGSPRSRGPCGAGRGKGLRHIRGRCRRRPRAGASRDQRMVRRLGTSLDHRRRTRRQGWSDRALSRNPSRISAAFAENLPQIRRQMTQGKPLP